MLKYKHQVKRLKGVYSLLFSIVGIGMGPDGQTVWRRLDSITRMLQVIPCLLTIIRKSGTAGGGNAPNSDNMSIRLMADVNGDGMQDMAYVINSKSNKDKVCTALSTGTSLEAQLVLGRK